MNIKRSNYPNKGLILENGEVKSIKAYDWCKEHGVRLWIRFREQEFNQITKDTRFVTHFNLQRTDNIVGNLYVLPLIFKPGNYQDGKETLPILSFENSFVAECLEVRNNVAYSDLKEEDFLYSFSHIKNVEQLKKVILEKYNTSMPKLSKEEILSLGVSISKLKITRSWEEHISRDLSN